MAAPSAAQEEDRSDIEEMNHDGSIYTAQSQIASKRSAN
jgi:hypothetical protein